VLEEQLRANAELKEQLTGLQQRWQTERLEAERTIRQLLDQLTQREVSQLASAPLAQGAASGSRDAA
jgi:hypothetical protein